MNDILQPRNGRLSLTNSSHSTHTDGMDDETTFMKTQWAEVDENGRLTLPPEVAQQFGLTPGARLRIETERNNFRLHRPVTHLAKLYIEATNHCNIDCATCMRNNWDVEIGFMSEETFGHILSNLEEVGRPLDITMMGIGEPLAHPRTIEMIAQLKALGHRVEMVTNGTLLNEKRARGLIEAGLDVLWVSIDGATPENFADIRLGAYLPKILENIRRFRRLRRPAHHPVPEIGIAFVAMKRNINDLPELLALGKSLGATRFSVSNLLPHSAEMKDEILYKRSLNSITYLPSPWLRHLDLPKMDFNELTAEPIIKALSSGYNVTLAGNNLGGANNVCTFIESGAMAIGWNGNMAPCPPLVHTHVGYLQGYERTSIKHILGNVRERSLLDVWHDPEYVAYRERVQQFAFAPCTSCGGCEIAWDNQTDCYSRPAPACGGCLWAQAVIQCP
ncbi:MAG: radical SAM protein [Ardenticatenaceae bacterium]|nr:radical SAM protein [Ardenticatenaceae bacterium]